jgi:hypothetical protein
MRPRGASKKNGVIFFFTFTSVETAALPWARRRRNVPVGATPTASQRAAGGGASLSRRRRRR